MNLSYLLQRTIIKYNLILIGVKGKFVFFIAKSLYFVVFNNREICKNDNIVILDIIFRFYLILLFIQIIMNYLILRKKYFIVIINIFIKKYWVIEVF